MQGNATFANFADDQNLGNLTINNILLRPGTNTFAIAAQLDQAKILQIMAKKPYCQNGIVPFQLLGLDVENNGQNLPYFQAALGSANQTVEIDIGAILNKSLNGYTLTCSK